MSRLRHFWVRLYRRIVLFPPIRWLTGRKPEFPQASRGPRRGAYAGWTAFLVVAGLAIGFYLFLNSNLEEPEANPTAQRSAIQLNQDSLSRLLSEGRADEIVQYLSLVEDDEWQPMPVRTETIKQKIALTRRLMDLRPTNEQLAFANQNNLDAQFALMRVHLQNDLADSIDFETLLALSGSLANSDDPTTRELSHLAAAYANIAKLATVSAANRAGQLERAQQALDDCRALDPDSLTMMNRLAEYVSDLRRAGRPDEATMLLKSLIEIYGSSSDPGIQQVVKNHEKQLFLLEYQLTSDNGRMQEYTRQVITRNACAARSAGSKSVGGVRTASQRLPGFIECDRVDRPGR